MSLLCESLEARQLLTTVHFAVIGDFGVDTPAEAAVANLVKGWNPEFIVTVGDNNYPVGAAATIDQNIGKYYHEFLNNYQGIYGPGSPTPRFFPALGNHDWGNAFPNPAGADPYLEYFTLPGNERYYEFVSGPAHFFVIDSDPNEPDGNIANGIQGQWLQQRLAAATEPHKLVFLHHAPYSSSLHGSTSTTQWPYAAWGATAVLAGHDHSYERLTEQGIPFFVNGVGGNTLYPFNSPIVGSQFRYNADFGAMLVDASDTQIVYRFYNTTGALIDQYTRQVSVALANVTIAATMPFAGEAGPTAGAFTVSRSGPTIEALEVGLAISGTAINGVDYLQIPVTATIPAGATSTQILVTPIDDNEIEGAETVTISLPPSSAYNVASPDSATVSIADNDDQGTLVFSGGSVWSYKDDGSDQGTAWRVPTFDDSSWSVGVARFGFGNPDIVTTINGGPAGNRFITAYFRTAFSLLNPAALSSATLHVLRDDGAVVYLNGLELWRTNMPSGEITATTFAASPVGGTDETTFFTTQINPALLSPGWNYLAVELHQHAINSSDAVFDMYITGLQDTSPPPPPARPVLAPASDSGVDDDDGITNQTVLQITGSAEAGSSVTLYEGATPLGTAAAAGGTYAILTAALVPGAHDITAVARDAAGLVSDPSPPLHVFIDTTPPALDFAQFAYNDVPMSVQFRFTEDVGPSAIAADLMLTNLTITLPIEPGVMVYDPSTNRAIFRFPMFTSGILPDGDYAAAIPAPRMTDIAGNPLAADAMLNFFFLNGDANRDRAVSIADFALLAANFNRTPRVFSDGDFDYDGTVGIGDFSLLASRFNQALPARIIDELMPSDVD